MGLEFTWWGVRWRFSFWFFALILLVALLDREVLALYVALPVLIHECGHLLVMGALGVRVRGVCFSAVSIDLQRGPDNTLGYGEEILLHLAGPIANLLVAGGIYQWAFPSMRMKFLVAVNLVTGLFNLLPIGNLDGGQVVRLLTQRIWGPSFSHRLSRLVSVLVLTPLFGVGMFLAFTGTGNAALLFSCLYLAVNVVFQRD